MKIKILLIIYNATLCASETLSSLFKADLSGAELEIIIWNNGPQVLSDDDVNNYISHCKTLKISTRIYQDIRNASLSKIYNNFINNVDYDFVSIFDQDTNINADFFQNIVKNPSVDIICPEIYLINKENVKSSPVYNKAKVNTDFVAQGEFNANSIFTCASGLSLSSHLTQRVLKEYGFVFNEAYAFYWVDHDLFERLRIFEHIHGVCIGKMYHDMSGAGNDYSVMKESAKLEHGYGKILRRVNSDKKMGLVRNLLYAIKYILKAKCSIKSAIKIIICALEEKHPRSRHIINNSIQPTHAYISE